MTEINPDILRQIQIAAGKYDISANVVYGVCMAESGMDPLAARHEMNYRWLYCEIKGENNHEC